MKLYGSLTNCARLFSFFRRCCRRYSALLTLHSCSRSLLVRSLIPSLSVSELILNRLLSAFISLLRRRVSLSLLFGCCCDCGWLFRSTVPSRSLARLYTMVVTESTFLCAGPDTVAFKMPSRSSSSCIQVVLSDIFGHLILSLLAGWIGVTGGGFM